MSMELAILLSMACGVLVTLLVVAARPARRKHTPVRPPATEGEPDSAPEDPPVEEEWHTPRDGESRVLGAIRLKLKESHGVLNGTYTVACAGKRYRVTYADDQLCRVVVSG